MNGYKSSTINKKTQFHLFLNFNKNLNLEKFDVSNLDLKVEKVTNDKYLKVFKIICFQVQLCCENKNDAFKN